VCLAATRILVWRPIYDRFVARLVERRRRVRVGDMFDTDAEMGPLLSRDAYAQTLRLGVESQNLPGAVLGAGERARVAQRVMALEEEGRSC
jgi:acyl-CoA reductase-like NAD-dependent aldehyde dehydrogenase